jgi:ADP-ribose pyrophosphatase YjhB (NUDIX family)
MPTLRTDLIDLYVARPTALTSAPAAAHPASTRWELLQLRRTRPPTVGCWHCVMGHVEPGESAIDTLRREAREELSLDIATLVPQPTRHRHHTDVAAVPEKGVWCLEQVHPYFVPELDAVVLSPRYVAVVPRDWQPRLNDEHDAIRWTPAPVNVSVAERDELLRRWLWPGQRRAVEELCDIILAGDPTAAHLTVATPAAPTDH